MKRIIGENLPIIRKEVSRDEAKAMFAEIGDNLKLELLDAIPEDETVSIYEQGEFLTCAAACMCRLQAKLKNLSC